MKRDTNALAKTVSSCTVLVKVRQMQEISHQCIAGLTQDGFGMKLHAMNWQGAVCKALNDAVVTGRCNPEDVGHGRTDHAERVIPRSAERAGDTGKKTGPIMENLRSLAMHNVGCAGHGGSEILANGLQAQTHPEYGESPDNCEAEDARNDYDLAWIKASPEFIALLNNHR